MAFAVKSDETEPGATQPSGSIFTASLGEATDMVSARFNFRVVQQRETYLLKGAHHLAHYHG